MSHVDFMFAVLFGLTNIAVSAYFLFTTITVRTMETQDLEGCIYSDRVLVILFVTVVAVAFIFIFGYHFLWSGVMLLLMAGAICTMASYMSKAARLELSRRGY